jgi:hypothetical protein
MAHADPLPPEFLKPPDESTSHSFRKPFQASFGANVAGK